MDHIHSLLIRTILCFLPLSGYLAVFAPATIFVSSLFFPGSSISGITLFVDGSSFIFIADCIAPLAYALLFALVMLTYGLSFRQRLHLILGGFSLIFLANMTRIVLFIHVYTFDKPWWLDPLHLVIWHIISGVYVAGVWIFLVKKYNIITIPIVTDFRKLWQVSYFSSSRTQRTQR